MTAILRKDFVGSFLKNSSYFCKSRFSFSVHILCFFSTSNENKREFNPEIYDFLLHKHHLSPEAASQAASVLTSLGNPQKSDAFLSFFKEIGFSNSHLERIVQYKPSLIASNLEKSIRPKIKVFQELGFSNNDIADIIATNPSILCRSANNRLLPSLSLLKGLLGSDTEVVKLLFRARWFISKDLEKCMIPNIDFFKNRSVPMEQIIRCLLPFPRLFLQKPENVRKYAEKAEEMGVEPSSKVYVQAVCVIGSMRSEVWESKLQAFRSLGFSENDILVAFRKYPRSFCVSVKKMTKVKDVLVSSGKYDLGCIVTHPITLLSSIERYKPRVKVLATLESKNVIKEWPSVSTLSRLSNKKFFEKFVGPYMDEVGHLFVDKVANNVTRKVEIVPSS